MVASWDIEIPLPVGFISTFLVVQPRPVRGRDPPEEREFFIDNLLFRIHFIIEMIWRTGLAPWEFEFPFLGSPTSTFQAREDETHLNTRGLGVIPLSGICGTYKTIEERSWRLISGRSPENIQLSSRLMVKFFF